MRLPLPVTILSIQVIYLIFFATYTSTQDVRGLDVPPCDTGVDYTNNPDDCIAPPDGIWDAIGGMLGAIWKFVQLLFSALTFNIDGAPWQLRTLITSVNGFAIMFEVVSLIRGISR